MLEHGNFNISEINNIPYNEFDIYYHLILKKLKEKNK